jgi:hypothetical protein
MILFIKSHLKYKQSTFIFVIKSMAYPNVVLIEGLRKAANALRDGAFYEWGNHGACNCGNLLQAVTQLTQEEIQSYALTGIGEWTEIAESWCPVTDAPVNLLMSKLEGIGLTPSDIHHLEYLDNREILQRAQATSDHHTS